MRSLSFLLRAVVLPVASIAALVWAVSSFGSYVRLVAFVALFVLVADLASLCRGRAQNVLVMVAALLLGVALLETVALAIEPRVEVLHPPGLWGARPELGWGPQKPGAYPAEKKVDGKTIYKVTYTIDDDLLRHTTSGTGPVVAFFGDSNTFGEGLDDKDTEAQAFADLVPGFKVVNLGFSAYSPAQALREMQVGLFDKELTGARAFVLLTGPWHSERTACKPNFSVRAPRYERVDGAIKYLGPCAVGLNRKVQEFYKESAAYQAFLAPVLQRPTHGDLETWLEIVGATAKLAQDKYGVPLVVLYVPAPDHYLDGTGFTDAGVRGRLAESGVHLVDAWVPPQPGQVMTIPGDGHPSALANRLVASKLVDDLKATLPDVLKPAGLR
ncbi:hypothetical protein RHAL1_01436 [Beijerinckiaceae bacterium RH AL1]|nr:SGNH/GDSL hydrolase family protein [Beijerinckiaceae bacterium]VVB44791.1 hypothetical protein RHCH11_RHCH11_01402 [Beijerinckiaceae bacterium RH CH11]VVB44870.1 hypothetical protein RHAL8_01399 [Beijerinckiaceae bacterium RH AL8]VVC54538.1 hypothetical protein RHAL1_01436 [Beijerinckiaceae bacterium RH AL1]